MSGTELVPRPQIFYRKKATPGTLLLLLKMRADAMPIGDLCKIRGISRSGLREWLERSANAPSDPTYNVTRDGETRRFHEWWEDAKEDAIELILGNLVDAASGRGRAGTEVILDRGMFTYVIDPKKVEAGAVSGTPASWLCDEYGNPVRTQVAKFDLEGARWLLEKLDPKRFGHRQQIDVNTTKTTNVLVVGTKLKAADLDAQFGGKQPIQDVLFEEVADEEEEDDDGLAS
jgi:hypothetical protein